MELSPGVEQDVLFIALPSILVLAVAVKGELFYNLSLDDVRMMLVDELRPKQESDFEDEIDEEEIYEENK